MLVGVTFTGIDNKTNIDEVAKLQKEFPFVEFGLLVSSEVSNKNEKLRFPHLTILKKLKPFGLNLSCHVCGSAARRVIQHNDWSEVNKLLGKDIGMFNRMQLNLGGTTKFSKEVTFPKELQVIIQLNKQHMDIYNFYRGTENILGFQDNSGGRGEYKSNWIEVEDSLFGYAGGIDESNVVETIEDLMIINDNDFWIDMESSVRTQDIFDLEKCRKIANLCKIYIKN